MLAALWLLPGYLIITVNIIRSVLSDVSNFSTFPSRKWTMIDSHPEPELIRLDHGQHDAADGTGSEERERLRLLGIRKKQELKLVKKFDKSKINVSKECWFLIDSDWLNKWSTFVNGDESEDCPDALSTIGNITHVTGTYRQC